MAAGDSEFQAWLIGFERAYQIWLRAPQGLKNAVLLEGEALARAERWHAARPEAFPDALSQFLDRSRSHRDAAMQLIQDEKRRNRRRRLAWIGDFALVAAVATVLFAAEVNMPDPRGLLGPIAERLPLPRMGEPELKLPRDVAKAPPGSQPSTDHQKSPPRNEIAKSTAPEVPRGRVFQKSPPPPRKAIEERMQTPARAPAAPTTHERRLADARNLMQSALKEIDRGHRETGLLIALDMLEAPLSDALPDHEAREALLRGLRETREGTALPLALRPVSDVAARAMAPTLTALAELPLETAERIATVARVTRPESLSLSPDRRMLAIGSGEDEAKIVDIASGRELAVLKGHVAAVQRTSFSRDGRRVATGAEDETIRLYEAPTGRPLHELRGHEGAITALHFSPDGTLLLSTAADRTARLWRVADGRSLSILAGHQGDVLQAEFSQDGRLVLTVGSDGGLRIWQAATGAALIRAEVADPIMTAALNQAGTHAIAATDEGEVLLVALENSEIVATIATKANAVRIVALDAEARRALSLDWSGRLTLIDLVTRRVVGDLTADSDAVESARFAEDGNHIEARTARGHLLSWPKDQSREDLVARARASVTRCLSAEERERFGLDHPPPRWCALMPRREASLTP